MSSSNATTAGPVCEPITVCRKKTCAAWIIALPTSRWRPDKIDATELYTTDAEIRRFDLIALEDDEHFFPVYQAIIVYRLDLEKRNPAAVAILKRLEGRISESDMIEMNSRAQAKEPLPIIAADFLEKQFQ